jgi:hypothetical protein
MDLSFFQRAEQRFARHVPAQLEFGMLVAMLQAQQGASKAARSHASWAAMPKVTDPIADILLAAPGWRRAVLAQRGSFNAAFAAEGAVN